MKVYLDNCAFNRPFDDQSHIRIRLESEAKLYIQEKIKNNNIDLLWSYILEIENDYNPFEEKRRAIEKWKKFAIDDIEESEILLQRANGLIKLGVKSKDALHVSAAVEGQADYFITTDDGLLKKLFEFKLIKVINPVDIVGVINEHNN